MIDNRTVQRALQAAGFYAGAIDGDFGRASTIAAANFAKARAPGFNTVWSPARIRIAVEQAMMADQGFYTSTIDGLNGPATQVAVEKWQDHITFVAPPPPVPSTPSAVWPRQADVVRFYGKVGENQTRLVSPYPLYLDWDISQIVRSFQCHEKIHDAVLRVMNRVADAYGLAELHRLGLDQFGGCLNVRRMRNGSAWSMHAWGIALDWDADRNPLRANHRTAQFAKPEYARFIDLWEQEGFVSLGRARDYDWMHFQGARL